MNILDKLKINHRPSAGALDLLKYIGPGLLVTCLLYTSDAADD